MAGEDHPLRAAQPGAGHHVVAVPVDREVRQGAQGRLDGVRERLLRAALGGEVDELRGQACGVQREVKRGVGHAVDPSADGLRPTVRTGLTRERTLQYLVRVPEPSPSLKRKRRGRLLRCGAAFAVLSAVAGYVVAQYVTGGTGGPGCKVVSGKGDGATYEFTPEQAVNAATISAVGTARDLPERAVTIALATALQESALRNIDYGDRDSLGLFQQRPSQGWGTPKQIMDPAYASEKFYEHLEKVPGYTRLPLTVAAQKVQRSGFPQAYAKHEPDATLLAAALTGRSGATLTCEGRPAATRAGARTRYGPPWPGTSDGTCWSRPAPRWTTAPRGGPPPRRPPRPRG